MTLDIPTPIDPKQTLARIRRRKGYMGWTDEEISTLASMWPKASVAQIATRLNRSCGNIFYEARQLRKKGLLKAKKPPRSRSIKPDLRDFQEVKRNYCRKHHIDTAELYARLERDDQLTAKLYRLAQAAKQARDGDALPDQVSQ